MLLDLLTAVWNHPQGRGVLISAIVAFPLWYNTPANRTMFDRFAPTAFVVAAIALSSAPSGNVKALQKELDSLRKEVRTLKRQRR